MAEEHKTEHTQEHKQEQPAEKGDIKAQLAQRRKLVFSHAIVGAIVGYISYVINVPLYALGLMIVLGVIFSTLVKKLLKPSSSGGKWWPSPVATYVFMWLVVWTILFNMYIVKP